MSEQAGTPAEKSKRKMSLPLVAVGIIAIIGGAYFLMQSGIDKAVVREQVDGWIAYAESETEGLSITYSDLEMAGGATDRHAVLRNVVAIMRAPDADAAHEADNVPVNEAPEVAQDAQADGKNDSGATPKNEGASALEDASEGEGTVLSKVTIPEMMLYANDAAFSSFRVIAPQPISIESANADAIRISANPPYEIHIESESKGDQPRFSYKQNLAGTWKIEPAQPDSSNRPITIEMKEGSYAKGLSALKAAEFGEFEAKIGGMAISSSTEEGEPEHLQIGAIDIHNKWRDFHQPSGAFYLKMRISDVGKDNPKMPYGAMNLVLDADYSGPNLSKPDVMKSIDWSKDKALLEIRELAILGTDIGLTARLSAQTGQGELMPVAQGNVTIKGFGAFLQKLKQEEKLEEGDEQILSAFVRSISGQELSQVVDLSIDIKRETGQSLTFGKASFEELFALVLTGGAMPVPSPHDAEPEAPDDATPEASDAPAVPAAPSGALTEEDVKGAFDAQQK